jgi:DnaJ-class molecular chaperone
MLAGEVCGRGREHAMRSGLMTLLALGLIAGAVFLGQRLPPLERVGASQGGRDTGDAVREGVRAVTTLIAGTCTACDGEGTIVCPACGGQRIVEQVRQVNCTQCEGSGRYESRIGTGRTGPCPFCQGTGKVEVQERGPCTRCEGTGRITCVECEGTGRAPRR